MYATKTKLHEREKNHIENTLKCIVFDVTSKCNMHCRFCYNETFANTEHVSLDILHRTFEEAYDLGVCHYVLQGGEVFADYDRLTAIIKMIHPDETYINIVSNGWLISEKRIEELKELGVDKISFSLDSGIEAEHDANRKLGSYKRVMKAVDLVKKTGLLSGFSTVVTHSSLYSEGFKKAYSIAKEKDIRFDVQIAEPVGKWDANRECLITKDDAEFIYNLYKESPIMKNGQITIKRDIFRGGHIACPAGRNTLSITANGNVLPCNFIQTTFGNIRDRSLKEIRDDILQCEWFNRDHAYCPIGESAKFFDEIVERYKDRPKPLDGYEVFGIKRKNSNYLGK